MWKRMERRWSQFTAEDVQALADRTPLEQYSVSWLAKGDYMPPFSQRLSGKKIVLRLDNGDNYVWNFGDDGSLTWNCNDGAVHQEHSQILETPGESEIFLVQYFCCQSAPPTAHTLVVDFSTGLGTLCIAAIGNTYSAREVQRRFFFGVMEGFEDSGARHEFTEELVGKAIDWTYHEKGPEGGPDEGRPVRVKHIYTAPVYYTYEMRHPAEGTCWVASNPADYIKINDHVYIFTFIEERQAGTQGFFLINMETLHDVGSFFGVQAHGIECCTFGAKGELTDPYAWDLCECAGQPE